MIRKPQSEYAQSWCCENCGSRPLRRYPTINSVMWHCPECDLYQKGQVVATEEYNLEYHNDYAARRKRKLWTALVRLGRIWSLVDTPRPALLDIGCSLGYTIEAGKRLGWDAQGVDINPQVVEYCQSRDLDCRLVTGDSLPYADESFDAVTAWHVIEHVSDVTQALAEWSRVLRPGGILALETPDGSCLKVRLRGGNYPNFWAAEHTYTFTLKNLTPFLDAAHLSVVSPPPFGKLAQLPPALAFYGAGYQFLKGLQQRVGLSKVFQLFCRRRHVVDSAVALRRAA